MMEPRPSSTIYASYARGAERVVEKRPVWVRANERVSSTTSSEAGLAGGFLRPLLSYNKDAFCRATPALTPLPFPLFLSLPLPPTTSPPLSLSRSLPFSFYFRLVLSPILLPILARTVVPRSPLPLLFPREMSPSTPSPVSFFLLPPSPSPPLPSPPPPPSCPCYLLLSASISDFLRAFLSLPPSLSPPPPLSLSSARALEAPSRFFFHLLRTASGPFVRPFPFQPNFVCLLARVLSSLSFLPSLLFPGRSVSVFCSLRSSFALYSAPGRPQRGHPWYF